MTRILELCRAGVRFLPKAWRRGGGGLIAVSVGVGLWAWSARVSAPAGGLLILPGLALACLAVQAALWTAALDQPPEAWRAGVLARAMLRMLAAWLLKAIFLFVLGLLALVVLLCTAYAVASAGPGFRGSEIATWAPAINGPGRLVFGAVGIVVGLGMVWAAARVSLASAATMGLGRVLMLSTWPLTRAWAWSLVLATLLLGAGSAALIMLAYRLSGPAGDAVAGIVLGGLWFPLNVGMKAYIWKRINPADLSGLA